MEVTKNQKIIAGALILALLIGIYIIFDSKSQKDFVLNEDSVSTATSTTEEVSSQSGGEYKIEQVSMGGSSLPKPVPDLDRKVVVYRGAVVAPEAKVYAEEKIKTLQARIKSNPADVLAWIDLGTNQKDAGDYDGAVLSWKYASKLSPKDHVSVSNLGNLYAYFIKDNGQAEVYYKQSVERAPNEPYIYFQLAEVYRDVFLDIDKAKAITEEGLKINPNNEVLIQMKNSLNK